MSLTTRIARWLAPELAQDADRFWWMRSEMESAQRWLGYEYPLIDITLSWLKYRDVDHWRPIDAQPVNKWPSDISRFRDWLRDHHGKKSTA